MKTWTAPKLEELDVKQTMSGGNPDKQEIIKNGKPISAGEIVPEKS